MEEHIIADKTLIRTAKVISAVFTSNPQHIVSNIDLFDFALTKEEMAAIDALNRNESYCSYDKP